MIRSFFPYLEMVSICFKMVMIAVRLQISLMGDLGSDGIAQFMKSLVPKWEDQPLTLLFLGYPICQLKLSLL